MSRRFRRRRWPGVVFWILVVVVIAVRWHHEDQRVTDPPIPIPGRVYDVKRVIDGDTLLLADETRVRLLGIDTPETKKRDHPVEPWGPEATDYSERFVTDAQFRVRLEFDKERVDSYGRLLAYVFAGERFLNQELVREGLAHVTNFRYSQSVRRRLLQAEDEARAAGRGIWSGPTR